MQRLGNVVGGHPIRYLNLEIEELKDIAISLIKVSSALDSNCSELMARLATLQDNKPIWFGCDVEKASNTAEGIMDTKLCSSSSRSPCFLFRR